MRRIRLPDGMEVDTVSAYNGGVIGRTRGQHENARIAAHVRKEESEQTKIDAEFDLLNELADNFIEEQFNISDVMDILRISLAPQSSADKEGRIQALREQEIKEAEIKEDTKQMLDNLVREGYLIKEGDDNFTISEMGKVFVSEGQKEEELE